MSKHNNYWDYTECERSELSSEDVKALLDYELMTKGVLKVIPPVYEEPTEVALNTETVYAIRVGYNNNILAFRDPEKAKQFCAMGPFLLEQNYGLIRPGESVKYLKPGEVSVGSVNVYVFEEVAAAREILERNKQIISRNERLKKEYNEAIKSNEEACKDIWDDWFECRRAAETCKRVQATLTAYRQMTGGDDAVARKFLAKAFSEEDIEAAEKWFSPEGM